MKKKHDPILDVDKVIERYEKEDGVPLKYVCTTSLGEYGFWDIFYRETPHPEFGNRYFGHSGFSIRDADTIEDLEFGMIEVDETYYYSRYRHDFVEVKDKFIDGGRDYIRTNTEVEIFKVKDGEFVKREEK